MKNTAVLIRRNMKLYFKDHGMFFTSLITPAVLLVLYATFLANVYRDSFGTYLPSNIPTEITDALVRGELISSLLAVSCITVAFCSNFLSVQDRVRGSADDLRLSPLPSSLLSLSYLVASLSSTLIVAFAALLLCVAYCFSGGCYMSFGDIVLLALDTVISVFFGTALSSVINSKLSSQGQISAVGTIVSSGYGFICGAYMPISSFSSGIQRVISFLPGTYGTALFRNHALRGAIAELEASEIPPEAIKEFRDMLDCNIYFFGRSVPQCVMYAVVIGSATVLALIFAILNAYEKRRGNY